MKKICILTQSHLCRNPRVVKEANTLSRAGYDVTILTTFTYADLLEEDLKLIDTKKIKYKGIINMIPEKASKLSILKNRIERRIAGEIISRFGVENVNSLGYDFNRNLKLAMREKADLYTCHQEASTVIGCKLIQNGFKAAFDLEDWYSHDLLPDANKSRPIKLLEKYEKFALNNAELCYTTSESLAIALSEFANSEKPKVLNNVFPIAERDHIDGKNKDRNDFDKLSIHWYSQTIGPGRGLEFIVDALSLVDYPVQLHLRGNVSEDYKALLTSRLPDNKDHDIYFHSLVPHLELLGRIAEHDIGLATEKHSPPSRNLTITNKILQYLLAGIAVVASDTDGQKEVAVNAPESVFLYENDNKEQFADILNQLSSDKKKLEKAKEKALEVSEQRYCWELQEKWLVKWINDVT